MSKRSVQVQFGPNAQAYAESDIHAKGTSLQRLVELTDPQPSWRVLDLATGPGHTAHIFSNYVRQVIAVDLTVEMLEKFKELGKLRGLSNEVPIAADAQALPFPAAYFDLVTCRLAAHHFTSVNQFMADIYRVLKASGKVAIVDNIVPGSSRKGKQAKTMNDAGSYINAFDKLRDPSHCRSLNMEEWQRFHFDNGFRILHEEASIKTLDFGAWVHRMEVPTDNIARLRIMLLQAPEPVRDFLQPSYEADRLKFNLLEAIFISKKETTSLP